MIRETAVPLAIAMIGVLAGGCISGSLASSTGPRPRGYRWSVAPRHPVHVGETVRFDFVLQNPFRRFLPPVGLADYCVVDIRGDRMEAEADINGHFQFAYTFDGFAPGEVIRVNVTAYRQRVARDFVKVGREWLRTDSPFDMPDQKVAADSIRMVMYEVPIELQIERPSADLDPDSGVLRIRRSDGSIESVYINRPNRRGFTITGPGPDGGYGIRYLPRGNELNPVGTTEVEFVIHDRAGIPHRASTTLHTP